MDQRAIVLKFSNITVPKHMHAIVKGVEFSTYSEFYDPGGGLNHQCHVPVKTFRSLSTHHCQGSNRNL